MKNEVKFVLYVVAVLVLSAPFTLRAQEVQEEKKVTVKTVTVIDGEKIVKDTTFVVTDEGEVKKVVKSMSGNSGDEAENIWVDVSVDTDAKHNKKVIVIKDDGTKKVKVIQGENAEGEFFYEFDHDIDVDCKGNNKKVIIMSPHGDEKVMKWHSEDGEEHVIMMEDEIKVVMKDLEGEMQELEIELEKLEDMETMVFVEKMEALEELEELEDLDIRVIRAPKSYHHPEFFEFHHQSHGATDQELRDAGIKNKPDRLQLNDLKLDVDDGVVDLSFTMATEGSPKVVVYNYFGDKVFNGKPEIMNGKYQMKIDLSQKQHGVYYLQIIQKNSSLTEKIEI